MIKKIFKALFCKNNFSTEWRKRNSHNFTIPATNFKMDAVQVGKGTYGNLFVVTRDYQNVKLFIRLPSDTPYTRQGKCFIRSIFPVLLLTSPVIPSPRHPFYEKAHFFSRRPADEPDFRFGQQPGKVTLPPYPDPDCHLRKKR